VENNNEIKKEITLENSLVYIKSFVFVLPLIFCVLLFYWLIWNPDFIKELNRILIENAYLTILILIIGIVLHELLHGIFWSFFIKKRFKSIRFGIIISSLTPYCHCKEPMILWNYLIGSMMPAILLGILPLFLSLLVGSFSLLIFGAVFIIGAGSDILMIWKLRKENQNSWVLDHPDKTGCFIYQSPKALE